jgi:hypothetical protein
LEGSERQDGHYERNLEEEGCTHEERDCPRAVVKGVNPKLKYYYGTKNKIMGEMRERIVLLYFRQTKKRIFQANLRLGTNSNLLKTSGTGVEVTERSTYIYKRKNS